MPKLSIALGLLIVCLVPSTLSSLLNDTEVWLQQVTNTSESKISNITTKTRDFYYRYIGTVGRFNEDARKAIWADLLEVAGCYGRILDQIGEMDVAECTMMAVNLRGFLLRTESNISTCAQQKTLKAYELSSIFEGELAAANKELQTAKAKADRCTAERTDVVPITVQCLRSIGLNVAKNTHSRLSCAMAEMEHLMLTIDTNLKDCAEQRDAYFEASTNFRKAAKKCVARKAEEQDYVAMEPRWLDLMLPDK